MECYLPLKTRVLTGAGRRQTIPTHLYAVFSQQNWKAGSRT